MNRTVMMKYFATKEAKPSAINAGSENLKSLVKMNINGIASTKVATIITALTIENRFASHLNKCFR